MRKINMFLPVFLFKINVLSLLYGKENDTYFYPFSESFY